MLVQSVRHEVYKDNKILRELLLARAMATSVIVNDESELDSSIDAFNESEILKDWFSKNE